MGSQQFLLIILGIITAALFNAFTQGTINAQAEESAKDSIILESNNLGLMSMRFFNTSSSMGGGGRSFSGWKIDSRLDITLNRNELINTLILFSCTVPVSPVW